MMLGKGTFPDTKTKVPKAVAQRCSVKGVLRNFAEFTEKHLCQSFFFNKVAGLVCNFIKKETVAHVFSCEISKKTFSYRTPPVSASEVNLNGSFL